MFMISLVIPFIELISYINDSMELISYLGGQHFYIGEDTEAV